MHTHRLLIIEDDEGIRNSLAEWVRQEVPSVEPIKFSTASEAYEHMTSDNPLACLIFVDVHLPGMSVAEFLEKKHALDGWGGVPAAAMSSGKIDEDLRNRDYVIVYLDKPFDLSKVAATIIGSCTPE